ncbi:MULTISPECIES: MarR family winged helix-turn-helix transcriptional regulator [unclassified Mesorhizobium]|uniref:MarR family winged helix-turn-helix transcriptional regulator n=1 Tax=unclassified Mesorhizobium TaxID=325217 RepID=UPI00112D7E9F|nr:MULTISPECIES: MarR family winged helix-turn-helix transcriptional regulator [unclassified Mesorhizobium]MBZ9701467.1 MarR family winged helix-turn-helix transcriptional regulator [Mesorhizobium sp. CO1-1-3]MBZ9896676.1 MarR family winged helix-turn-helix transcriptional regulator [Mesorhizobium sp. BR1-1-6]MBZ9919958.1 MarR family winged helix-turn-helix transcriptional regulator [Mesorhizobium sp. BR1-1-7]MBZ9948059.1 MarR family winged helix-turn-helix transcriptional regulator [Mesorhizob
MSDMSHPQKPRPAISQADYQRLSEFRYLIRRFLEFSQLQAEDAGLTSRQHQALLAIKGFPGGGPVAIGDLAERLRIRHHSAVELVNRLCEAGLIVRDQDKDDQRKVLLQLTERADACLADLSAVHLDELSRIEPMLRSVLARKDRDTLQRQVSQPS